MNWCVLWFNGGGGVSERFGLQHKHQKQYEELQFAGTGVGGTQASIQELEGDLGEGTPAA